MHKIALFLAVSLVLSACNTFEGMGKDVQNAGEGITDSAKTVKKKINDK